jgi:hypothetical protein
MIDLNTIGGDAEQQPVPPNTSFLGLHSVGIGSLSVTERLTASSLRLCTGRLLISDNWMGRHLSRTLFQPYVKVTWDSKRSRQTCQGICCWVSTVSQALSIRSWVLYGSILPGKILRSNTGFFVFMDKIANPLKCRVVPVRGLSGTFSHSFKP